MFLTKLKSPCFNSSKLLLSLHPKANFSTKMPVVDGKVLGGAIATSAHLQPWVDIENRLSKIKLRTMLSESSLDTLELLIETDSL
jgi:hypothetical protein